MKRYLILFIIFIIAISVITINAKTIYAIKDSEGNLVGATDQGYLSYEQIEQGFTIEILFESGKSTNSPKNMETQKNVIKTNSTPAPEKPEPDEQLPEAKLEIQDWSNRPSETGNYVYIEGIIKNIGKGNAYSVQVTAKGLDKYGNLVALEKGYTTPTSIAPDKTATFQIMMKNYEKLDKFGLSWNWNNES
jgi:hypothetical protein